MEEPLSSQTMNEAKVSILHETNDFNMINVVIEGEEFEAASELPILMTVIDVKQNLAQQLGLHQDNIMLMHNGKEMRDNKNLQQCQVKERDIITCVIKEDLDSKMSTDYFNKTHSSNMEGEVDPRHSRTSRSTWTRGSGLIEKEAPGDPGTEQLIWHTSRSASKRETPGQLTEDPFSELDEDFDAHMMDFAYKCGTCATLWRTIFATWKTSVLLADVLCVLLLAYELRRVSAVYSAILVFLAAFPSALTAWSIALKNLQDRPKLSMFLIMFPFFSVLMVLASDALVAAYVLLQNCKLLCCGGSSNRNPFLESYKETRLVYQALLLSCWELIVVFFILGYNCNFCEVQSSSIHWGYFVSTVFFGFANICNCYLTITNAAEVSLLPAWTYLMYTLSVWGGYMDNQQIFEAKQNKRRILDLSRVKLGNFSYDMLVQCLLSSKNKVEAMDINLDTLSLLTSERCANLGMVLRSLNIELFVSLPLSPVHDAPDVFRQFDGSNTGYVNIHVFTNGLKQLPKMWAKARKLKITDNSTYLKSLLDGWEVLDMIEEIQPLIQSKNKIMFSEFCLPRVLEKLQPLLRLNDPRAFAAATENQKLIKLLKNYQPPVQVYDDVDNFEVPRLIVPQVDNFGSPTESALSERAHRGSRKPSHKEIKNIALQLKKYCDQGSTKELKHLVEKIGKGTNLNGRPIIIPVDAKSNTVLHCAAKQGNIGAVRLFLNNLPDPAAAINMINTNGATPLTLAEDGKHKKLVQLLSKSVVTTPGNR